MVTSARRRAAAWAWPVTLAQVPGSNVGQWPKAKRRPEPGAMPRAMRAASMAMVPDPQNGSTRGLDPSQPTASSIAAAKRLAQGRLGAGLAVAATVQVVARAVDADGHLVACHSDDEALLRGAFVWWCTEPRDDSIETFGDGIGVVELRPLGRDVEHRHHVVGQPARPLHVCRLLLELGERRGPKVGHAHEHTRGAAQPQVGQIELAGAGHELDPATKRAAGTDAERDPARQPRSTPAPVRRRRSSRGVPGGPPFRPVRRQRDRRRVPRRAPSTSGHRRAPACPPGRACAPTDGSSGRAGRPAHDR